MVAVAGLAVLPEGQRREEEDEKEDLVAVVAVVDADADAAAAARMIAVLDWVGSGSHQLLDHGGKGRWAGHRHGDRCRYLARENCPLLPPSRLA